MLITFSWDFTADNSVEKNVRSLQFFVIYEIKAQKALLQHLRIFLIVAQRFAFLHTLKYEFLAFYQTSFVFNRSPQ